MTVDELIEKLTDVPDDAEVLVGAPEGCVGVTEVRLSVTGNVILELD